MMFPGMRAKRFYFLAAIFCGFLGCWARGADAIVLPEEMTVAGVTYRGVRYQAHDAVRVRFSHEDGVAAVEIPRLPPEAARRFSYDARAAAMQKRAEEQMRVKREEAQMKRQVMSEMDQIYRQSLSDVRRGIPEPPADIGVELSNVAFGRKKEVLYRDAQGGSVVEILRSRGVQAKVTNKGKFPFRGALRVYFFGRAEGRLYCFDGAQVGIQLPVLESETFRFDTALSENKGSLPAQGTTWKKGGSYAGQAAEVVDRAGRRVAFFASIPAITPQLVDAEVKMPPIE